MTTFFRKVPIPATAVWNKEYPERVNWCKQMFGNQVKGGNWWRHRDCFYFKDEKIYMLYMLRWS